jgi:hypothetical protein
MGVPTYPWEEVLQGPQTLPGLQDLGRDQILRKEEVFGPLSRQLLFLFGLLLLLEELMRDVASSSAFSFAYLF